MISEALCGMLILQDRDPFAISSLLKYAFYDANCLLRKAITLRETWRTMYNSKIPFLCKGIESFRRVITSVIAYELFDDAMLSEYGL